MNIEEERKAFEKYIKTEYEDNNPIEWFDGAPVKGLHLMLWNIWQASANREGFVLVPKEPTEEMWGGLSRVLGRYMQSKERYCPKTLKRYLDMFAKDIPDWLNKEVTNWNSDHAFATADLPVFIYKAMIEAQEQTND